MFLLRRFYMSQSHIFSVCFLFILQINCNRTPPPTYVHHLLQQLVATKIPRNHPMTSHGTDYRPVSLSYLQAPTNLTSNPHRFAKGLTYSDVAVTSPYDDDQSASTSDSQSSVIHVSDSRRTSLVSNGSCVNAINAHAQANGDCAELKPALVDEKLVNRQQQQQHQSNNHNRLPVNGSTPLNSTSNHLAALSPQSNQSQSSTNSSRGARNQPPASMTSRQQLLQQRTCESPTPQTTVWSPSGQFTSF